MSVAPIIIGGGVLLYVAQLGEGLPQERAAPSSASLPPIVEPLAGWCWPLASWQGRKPVASDKLGSDRDGGARKHHGWDIDFSRSRGELPEFPPGTRQGSAGGLFFCPDGVTVRAARAGVLWSCSAGEKGISVVLDHGKPFATLYMHLRSVVLPYAQGGKNRVPVRAGQVIGVVGNGHNPGAAAVNGFNHLHFEVWRGGGAESFTDPGPYLKAARVLSEAERP